MTPVLEGIATRTLVVLALGGLLATAAVAAVTVDLYPADASTPLPLRDPNSPGLYRDIMVGTELSVVVSSSVAEPWDGMLWFPQDSWPVASIAARDYSDEALSYVGSCLEAAGFFSRVAVAADDLGDRFNLSAAGNPVAGDWFVLDYRAEAVGTCYLGLYQFGPDPNAPPFPVAVQDFVQPPGLSTLLGVLAVNHVRSRDYDDDGIVNFYDFALLATQWQQSPAEDPNTTLPSDLDTNGCIDVSDMALFSDYWLQRTRAAVPIEDPNDTTAGL